VALKRKCMHARVGILEQRGNSSRVVHYRYVDGKRIFTKHTVKGTVGNNGNSMGTEKANTSFFYQNNGGRSLAWLGLRLPEPTTRVRIPAAAPA
jgi:hypothetical protein